MSPAAIIALVKDGLIIGAVGFLIYLFIGYGKDSVRIADIKALEAQLAQNSQTQAKWYKEWTDADTQRDVDLAQINATIARQHNPIILRNGPSTCPVPQVPTSPGSISASAGGTSTGSGVDLRPQINAYELRVEKVVADCRDALQKWPQ